LREQALMASLLECTGRWTRELIYFSRSASWHRKKGC